MTVLSERPRLWLCALALLWLAACGVEPFTEVVGTIDLQPRVLASTDILEVRVWDSERQTVVFEEIMGAPPGPQTLPLFPRNGDAERTFLVEVVAKDAAGELVAIGRTEGTYLADQRVATLVCLTDECLDVFCGDPGPCAEGECTSCRGTSGTCQAATAELVPLGTALSCPPPTCLAEEDVEKRCADGVDDDCNGLIDCADQACDGIPCNRPGFTCQGGECLCNTREICTDGVNNDCDALVDCEDDECIGEVCNDLGMRCIEGICAACDSDFEVCDNGVDDDCDGLVDCQDPDCCENHRCDGQRCGSGNNAMCCNGSCQRIDQPGRCGGCDIQCPWNTETMSRRACLRVTGDPDQPEPTWLCYCKDNCLGGLECRRRFDVPRCNCSDDEECGPGLQCRRTGPDRHNWCRPFDL